jgi:hypothetical protein
MFPVILSTCCFHFTHTLVTDREFFGSRCQNRDTKIAAWVGVGSARLIARSIVRAGSREDERHTSNKFVSWGNVGIFFLEITNTSL